MSDDIVVLLNLQAEEIAESGHNGWGNTMLLAAKEIEKLRQELEAANAAHKSVSKFFKDKEKQIGEPACG